MTALDDVILSITNGQVDDNLEAVRLAVENRRKTLASLTKLKLKIGDRVRLTKIRPKSLEGALATVSQVGSGRLKAILDAQDKQPPGVSLGRFTYGADKMPVSLPDGTYEVIQ